MCGRKRHHGYVFGKTGRAGDRKADRRVRVDQFTGLAENPPDRVEGFLFIGSSGIEMAPN